MQRGSRRDPKLIEKRRLRRHCDVGPAAAAARNAHTFRNLKWKSVQQQQKCSLLRTPWVATFSSGPDAATSVCSATEHSCQKPTIIIIEGQLGFKKQNKSRKPFKECGVSLTRTSGCLTIIDDFDEKKGLKITEVFLILLPRHAFNLKTGGVKCTVAGLADSVTVSPLRIRRCLQCGGMTVLISI